MRHGTGRHLWLLACLAGLLLCGCGGGGSGVVTGKPQPVSPVPIIDPEPNPVYVDDIPTWVTYDRIYRNPSNWITDPEALEQRRELNALIWVEGYNWAREYQDLHLKAQVGKLMIASSEYMLASSRALDLEYEDHSEILFRAAEGKTAYVIYALEGMEEDWRITQVGLDAYWHDLWPEDNGEVWVGLSSEEGDSLKFNWSGPFHHQDQPQDVYLYGFDQKINHDNVYLCIMVCGEVELELSALQIGIAESSSTGRYR